MKTLLIALTLLMSSQTFAATCKISGKVNEKGQGCVQISTRLDVSDVEACEAFTKATEENRFFGIIGPKDQLINARYKFKDKVARVKIDKTFTFIDDEDICF